MVCCGQPLPDTSTPPPPPVGGCCLRTRYTCECPGGVTPVWVLDMTATACVQNTECGAGVSCSSTEFVSEVVDGCECAAALPALPTPTCSPSCCPPTQATTTTTTTTTTPPPCSNYPAWTTSTSGGGSFSSVVGLLQFDFADSVNCGGSNPNTQAGEACAVVDGEGGSRTVSVLGNIENQDPGYDCIDVFINGSPVINICSNGGNAGCTMESRSGSAPIPSGPGQLIEVQINSVDGAFHQGAYWRVTVA